MSSMQHRNNTNKKLLPYNIRKLTQMDEENTVQKVLVWKTISRPKPIPNTLHKITKTWPTQKLPTNNTTTNNQKSNKTIKHTPNKNTIQHRLNLNITDKTTKTKQDLTNKFYLEPSHTY